jgi:molybdopterin-containing oxidoreductase family iron-sulfur binding subunit
MPSLKPSEARARRALRAQLGDARGPVYWRALEELYQDPRQRELLQAAVPQLAWLDPAMDRRSFIRLLGASLGLAGLGACSGPPAEQIVPWVRQPENMPQSLPQFYATSLRCGGDVAGVLVETHAGRPAKIEGNPAHPASLGGSDALAQAAVLELWDPDRSQAPTKRGIASTWNEFEAEAASIRRRAERNGAGLHVLSGRIDSPTLAKQRQELLQRFPGAQWHRYEPIDESNVLRGAQLSFGAPLRARYRFERAGVILALEADFLGDMPGHLRHARKFAERRKPELNRGAQPPDPSQSTFSRLYAVEATPSLTGAKADHAWPLASADIVVFVYELAAALGIVRLDGEAKSGIAARFMEALVADLDAHRETSLLLAGRSQPPEVHAWVHRINAALGNIGNTVEYFAWPEPLESAEESLPALTSAMQAGDVETLLILESNPVYDTPAVLSFAQRLAQVPLSVHLGLYRDETAQRCSWHLPAAHALEAWSDLRSFDGTAGLVQPVIAPLYQGRSVHELLALIAGQAETRGHAIVRASWRKILDDGGWDRSLREGFIADSAPAAHAVSAVAAPTMAPVRSTDDRSVELVFRPDPRIWDGRYANNAWLQELPKPLTQITWNNAALISPQLAELHGLRSGDVIAVSAGGARIEAPVWILPGQATRSITLPLGYGRDAAGHVGDALGFDAYAIRSVTSPWQLDGGALLPLARSVELATTQQHHSIEGRAPIHAGTLAQFLADPTFAQRPQLHLQSLYPERARADYAWGMSIDLNACIGCSACTAACQAENNIPVVGAEEVKRGREMHWIRVDRYYEGGPGAPQTLHQPVPCMHCEHAPCEVVCPVGATVHDAEGLNLQVYNRCVGTRFCSNNCPYKVRRFNFLQYSDLQTEQLKAQRNPDVTVRNRGVMEKCTYCIQRIETARIAADRDDRRIGDGEIVTACQAACPTQAITFGNVDDPRSAVSLEKSSTRNYTLLPELNTRPRTTYLASLSNPNPLLLDEA